MTTAILTLEIRSEHDVVLTRQRARQIAELCGFDGQEQAFIGTAVSEIARNAFQYAGGGRAEFALHADPAPGIRQCFQIVIRDHGPGIRNLRQVLDGQYRSPTGMGLGLVGARRLMDRLEIESSPETGTVITMAKDLPARASRITPAMIARMKSELTVQRGRSAYEEFKEQNQELLRALADLRQRNAEVDRLNRELEETNRGVVALYMELDEKAEYLQKASELKSRFLSHMSHEFRTPLNSILTLSRLLLDRIDGPLSDEQEKQVRFIRRSAEDLTELVNDLLDLAKIEAGKITVKPTHFEVAELFGTLRGVFRAVGSGEKVALHIEEPQGILPLYTDEGKVAQILRNFISNALKFTERGEVRVTATADGDHVVFSVADTGIGIAPDDQERIFEEFVQVEGPVQTRVRGTGLGLPLSRKLAELLGGGVSLESAVSVGSTFRARIPLLYPAGAGEETGEGAREETRHA